MVSTEHLIEIIKKYPPLYDSQHPKFGNKKCQEEVWMRIAGMFKVDVKTVKTAWDNIKETFIKYIKDEKSDCDRHMKKGYSYLHFIKCMEFFKPFFNLTNGGKPKRSLTPCPRSKSREREYSEHSESTDITVSFSDDFLSDLKNPIKERGSSIKSEFLHRNIGTAVPIMVNKNNLAHPTTQNREVQSVFDDDQSDLQRSQLTTMKRHQDVFFLDYPMKSFYMNHEHNNTLDAIELIFLGYAKTLKTFSPIRQTYTKMKIAQIIMEQEMQHLDENPNSPTKFTSNLLLGTWTDANNREPRPNPK